MPSERSRWRWPRWVYLTLFVVAISYLAVRTINFLSEAQMSLGMDRTPGAGLEGILVNQQSFNPPSDSLMRPAQVHYMIRIAEAIDSLQSRKASTSAQVQHLSAIMNDHLISKAAYTWTRSQIVRALFRRPISHVDSAHHDMMRMLRPRFYKVRHVYTDSLDRMLLAR